eukprot:TRINITY_DN20264_c0_g1_i1.p1 TRINITY_DN20264_c0_g1~~TRINITY_DN20264_c0_g1_i1.p1  ORF type:complete len:400 (-),score=79.22 TRINITY_DN20264_c0_g1_i1:136-1335(-)
MAGYAALQKPTPRTLMVKNFAEVAQEREVQLKQLAGPQDDEDGDSDLEKLADDDSKVGWSRMTIAAVVCILWVLVGVVAGVYFEGWRPLTALYVVTQIVTTIGYGDVTVSSREMMAFMTVYVIVGLVLVANILTIAEEKVIGNYTAYATKKMRDFEIKYDDDVSSHHHARNKYASLNRLMVTSGACLACALVGTAFFATTESCTCSYGTTHDSNKIVPFLFENGTAVDVDICKEGASHDDCMKPAEPLEDAPPAGFTMSWLEAFYMSVITMTTVGFGDFTPKSKAGRAVGIVWMIVSVACTVTFLGATADFLKDLMHSGDGESKKDENNEHLFTVVDADGDGNLDFAEYALYVMLKHKMVDPSALLAIHNKYKALDTQERGHVDFATVLQFDATQSEME